MPSDLNFAGEKRFIIHRLAQDNRADTFLEDVRTGLTSRPKVLSPRYFYDELGSQLFEAICRLPEYYLTRAESEILRNHADEIVGMTRGRARLIELGSGAADKTRFLINALFRRQRELHYLPIDISDISLERSSAVLLLAYPRIWITGYAADYFAALRTLSADGVSQGASERTIILFLGSNIGNFDQEESVDFLRHLREMLGPDDCLLMGADLQKSPDALERAYDDALGLTAAFNLNLLVRINRELKGNFELKSFKHRAVYNESLGRVEMHLIARGDETVRIEAADLEVRFYRDESIHTENSYKFTIDQLNELARSSGFVLERTWFDSQRSFSFNLLSASTS